MHMPDVISRGTASTTDVLALSGLLARARQGQVVAQAETSALRAEVPLRYLRQQSHLTAPANDLALAEKAIAGAPRVASRLLERYAITNDMLAARLGVSSDDVDAALATATPLVLLDLEDGVPPPLVAQARANAVTLFRDADWGPSLRFFRPASLTEDRCAEDLIEVLMGAGAGLSPERFPIDGLVYPKVRHPHEVAWLYGLLDEVERELGLPAGRIRVIYQLETGWGLQNLGNLAVAGRDRLAGMVLGTVDLAADVLLPDVSYRHPICEWARHTIVTVAGAIGVPAIDGMTLDFPIGLPDLSADENRELVLSRMQENFVDATHSIEVGMAGRWVGHPLQLLATLLAFRAYFSVDSLGEDIELMETFAAAMASERGAVAGARGELLDIGTDRHVRSKLRRAAAWGLLPTDQALALGIVTAEEMAY
jgi:citrate lyase beta subunit